MTEQKTPEFTTISVECDGATAAWVRSNVSGETLFTGNPDIAKAARKAARRNDPVSVFGYVIEANEFLELGALAALFAYDPGRTIVLEGTPEVDEFVELVAEEDRIDNR